MFLWKLAPIIGTQADLQENHTGGVLSINNKLLTHAYWVQSIPSKQSFNDIPHAGELWVNMHGNYLSPNDRRIVNPRFTSHLKK